MHLPTHAKENALLWPQIQPCCALIGWRSAQLRGGTFPLSHHQLNNLPFYVTDAGIQTFWRKIISTPTFPNLLRVGEDESKPDDGKSLPKFQRVTHEIYRRGTSPFANQSDVEAAHVKLLWQSAGNQTRSGWRICFSCWFSRAFWALYKHSLSSATQTLLN